MPASLGIDLIYCPKAEPQKLPPDALAGAATEAGLDQVLSIFGEVDATEHAYVVAAHLVNADSGAVQWSDKLWDAASSGKTTVLPWILYSRG
jgi:hypothetical protein